MEIISEFFGNPITAAVFGWLAFNVMLLRIDKEEYDNSKKMFPLREYFMYVWDNWLASLLMIPILLYVGQNQLNITLDEHNLQWNNLYYVGAGFFTELVIVAWKKWKSKNQ